MARKSLARLVELRVLSRLERRVGGVRAGSAAYVYETGLAGQRLVTYWQGEGITRIRGAHEPGAAFVAHTLATSEVYVSLTEAARISQLELLAFEAEPDCWRDYIGIGGKRAVLKPDIYLRLGLDEFEDSWFVEVDRATESRNGDPSPLPGICRLLANRPGADDQRGLPARAVADHRSDAAAADRLGHRRPVDRCAPSVRGDDVRGRSGHPGG